MRKFAFAMLGLALVAQSASAATVTVTPSAPRDATAQEIGGDATLAGKKVYDFLMTTSGDVLSINEVTITLDGTTNGSLLYQNGTGSDVEPPNPLFLPVFPALGADSWITTPGGTSTAGGGFAAANSSWFDTDTSPASNNTVFARLTTGADVKGTFNFSVSVPSNDGSTVESFPFSFPIGVVVPEPATAGMASMGLLALAALRRRK